MIDTPAENIPAILGGSPSRLQRILPRFRPTEQTRQRVMGLLEEGLLSDWFGGPISHEFEAAFAQWHGVRHAIAVNSGTSALHTAVVAAGLGPGDEVLLPTSAYHSAASAILLQNAAPVPCDIEPRGLTLSTVDMKRKITPNTRAIMPVHLYGYPSDMEEICRFASEQNLMIIEDCGQSHGAQIMGKYVGTMGHLGCYSFAAPRKHINVGEGGMVITNDDTLAQICRQVVNKGKDDGWMTYRRMGFSYTMPEFTAIVGLQGLAFLDEEIEHRRKAAQVYSDMFASTSLTSEPDPSDRKHTYFRYVLKLPPEFTRWRDWFIDAIMAENISIRPPHLAVHCIDWLRQQNAYRNGCPYTCQHLMQNGVPWPQRLPVADRELPTVVDIETGPGLSEDDARLTARGIVKVWTYLQDHANEIEPTSHASPR